MTKSVLGIVGGSGFYHLPGIKNPHWEKVTSPWGEPSDEILFAELDGLPFRFLPRHGRGHRISPTHINYRANIDALKRSGVTDLVSISACGSLKDQYPPGHFVLRRPVHRPHLRAREELLRRRLRRARVDGASRQPAARRVGGEGSEGREHRCDHRAAPTSRWRGRSSRRAPRCFLYRSWGCDVIGMTNMPEAKLAREAEICYATVAMVTDYDCWHDEFAHVDVAAVIAVMKDNAEKAQRLVHRLAEQFPREHPPCPIGSDTALDVAIITAPEARDPR